MLLLCLQGCNLRSNERVTASHPSLSETRTTFSTGTELLQYLQGKQTFLNKQTGMTSTRLPHVTTLDKKYVQLQWDTGTCVFEREKFQKSPRQFRSIKTGEVSARLDLQDSLIRTCSSQAWPGKQLGSR